MELYVKIGEKKYSRVAMPALNIAALREVLGYNEELIKKVKKVKVAYT